MYISFNHKFMTFGLWLLASLILAACSTKNNPKVENYIGLYKVIGSNCMVPDGSYSPCDDTLFFEIVQGQFIGIENSDFGYVFWSGDPSIEPELQYQSYTFSQPSNALILDNELVLNDDGQFREYILLAEDGIIEYHGETLETETTQARKVHYVLEPTRRGKQPSVRLNYPGNQIKLAAHNM